MSTINEKKSSLVSMDGAKRWLALIWFSFSGILFLILLIQTFFNHYGTQIDQAWSWLLPSVLPTLSLIVGVLASDAAQHDHLDTQIDRFLVRCAIGFSVVYLLVVLSTILLQPVSSGVTPLTLMHRSQLFLSPFQGLVSALLGVFFVRQGKRETGPAEPKSG
jgi:hypothetical protein